MVLLIIIFGVKRGINSMKKMKNAHIWIGLICSIFILIESITGLIMNEPWLIGQKQMEQRGGSPPNQMMQPKQEDNNGNLNHRFDETEAQDSEVTNGQGDNETETGPGELLDQREPQSQGGIMGLVRRIHEGLTGNSNLNWLNDLVTITFIIVFLEPEFIYQLMF
ncbi:PepSY domain-containing protein [Paracerasibacillus soli]|uniref:PepSY domain-containing protein n=1 Tax=Paracerasibacillus soli TaxID=480284 RepID=A0ABU5CPA8_9BACI|nr:PepSY domain-containing protein [Virgibacillus soli]MDY0407682.1 PepSY domain-containing protein [Virgibacillus soli]